jgi:lon-related putative ATP-dependent protease
MTNESTADRITRLRVPPEDLYRRCDPAGLPFETTAEVPPIDGTVGQERALGSLDFALDIEADGYNLFVAGPAGTGRNSTLRAVVGRIAARRPGAPDWCYVHNFEDHRQPSVISLPAGRGHALARDVDAFIEACRQEIPRHFESEAYTERREELGRELQAQRERAFQAVEEEAKQLGFTLNVTPMGVATIPLKPDGQPMTREEFGQLPEERRRELQATGEQLQSRVSQAMLQARRLEKEAQSHLEELNRAVALYAITPLLNELRQEYMDIPKAVGFLEQIEDDIIDHLDQFRAADQESPVLPFLRPDPEDFFSRYKVNIVVSRERDDGAPVVIENNPTYYNLFGRVDYRSQLGAVSTDHTMIKAGALHRANGGYLILQALDVLIGPLVWETLKRTLRSREVRIENLGEQYSAIPVATLNPEPIPLRVKVVLVGSPYVYYVLSRIDEDFRKLFRVKADFTTDMDRSDECVDMYSGFISSRVRDEGLRHFDRGAVARIVEHGSRLVDHQGKLSARFIDIADLLTEADFWAGRSGADIVRAEHVEQAIERKAYRSNLIEERIHELIEEGTIFIDTSAAVAGQVNGISVYELGDYRFGRPSRITARVSLGRGQVVSIDREINLSGRIHNKAFAIVNGYLHGKFAQERPLSLTASIGFEQTYDEVEGDSASAAELYALLSALAEVPLKQGIAVTGSVNQRGEVQPIGAVNEKIEGFYAVCKAKGLTGEQGVVIPKANVRNLMLKREVVDACREGRFHVWAVEHVDEGIEVLTGVAAGEADARGRYPAGTVHRRAADRLAQMSRRLAAAARRRPRPPAGTPAEGENQEQQERPAPDA